MQRADQPVSRQRVPHSWASLAVVPILAAACLLGPALPPLPTALVVPTSPPATELAAASAAPTGEPSTPPVFGIELSQLDAAHGLDQARAAGAYWLRRAAVWWPDVEAVEGSRDWGALSGMEQEFAAASGQGAQVILVVRGTPDWAQAAPGSVCGAIRPHKLAVFGDFVYELVSRYSVAPYNVLYWEMWNEPDLDPALAPAEGWIGCWGDPNDSLGYGGGNYADMLAAAYPRLKTANPKAQLVAGALLLDCDPDHPPEGKDCAPARFLQGILDHHGRGDGASYFDGLSFHAYDYASLLGAGQYFNPNWDSHWNTTGPVVFAKAQFVKRVLASYGVTGKFLMNTESAVIAGELQCFSCDFPDAGRRTMKDDYVAQVYAAALAEGLTANVWYSMAGWRGSALIDGSGNPVPALAAYRFAAAELSRAAFVRELGEFAGVKGYEFRRDGGRVWVLWSLDGATHHVAFPEPPQSLFDVRGQPLSPAAEIDLGLSPLYVEWAADA